MRLLLLPLFSYLSAVPFNAQHLKQQAEIDGFGYKTANLLVLKNLAGHINQAMAPYFITVPDFVGIDNVTIQQLLKAQGIDLAIQWHAILEQTAGPHQQEKMLKNKQLNSKLRLELEVLQQRIMTACKQASTTYLATLGSSRSETLRQAQGERESSLADFLTMARKNEWQLMVRSTGKEDSESLANAGGNVSVANVPTNDSLIMQAIGEVIASYVSVKSMQQRLQAGDPTVFEVPFLPVLIQRMIGEPIGGAQKSEHIPTGCVLYTTETDGFTPGVALAQATFGHNEGVVQSSMPIDTFYLCKDVTYASIKQKTKRLVPGIASLLYTLIEQQNPESIIQAPSLDPRALKSLSIIAHEVELFYGKPMDLELVVMPHEQAIYLVQARPIVMPKQKETPRYIRDIALFKPTQCIPCTIINSNRGALLEKIRTDNIIMAKSLEKALASFNELTEGKDDIRVIAVEEEAETTSHAAAVFRGEGKVIIRMPEGLKPLEDALLQPKAKVAISTQQGLIIDITDQVPLTQDNIASGLTSHPANLPLSIIKSTNFWPRFSLLHTKTDLTAHQLLHKLKSKPTDRTLLNSLCDAVGKRDSCEIDASLQSATKAIQQALRKKRSQLQQFIHATTHEISQAQTKELRVFHSRMLELALTQEPQANYVDTYSHASLLAEASSLSSFLNKVIAPAYARNQISTAFVHNPTILAWAQDGYNRCLTSAEHQAWLTLLDAYALHGKIQPHVDIAALLIKLIEHDLLGGWINTSLVQTMERYKGKDITAYIALSSALTFEFNSAQSQLTPLNKILDTMMNIQPMEWENPKKFDALFTRFNASITTPLQNDSFDDLLALCETIDNNVLKLAVITALKKITDRYDLFIKAIKSSTQYPNKKLKIQHFHKMLTGYVSLLEKVCDNEDLINAMQDRLNDYDENNENELVVSGHFNVNVVVQQTTVDRGFGQEKFFDYIESLEDLFTSTHQVLLYEISKKIVDWNITQALNKPELVIAIEEVLELEDNLTGIRFEGTKVIFTYNRQLRAHSIQIEICHDCATKQVTLSYHFYGINEFLRWNLIKDYTMLISPKLGLDVERIVLKDYGLSLYWHVQSADKAHALDELLEDVIDVTFELSIENRKTIFDNLDTTMTTLFEKCSKLYGSSEQLTKHLSNQKHSTPFNLLALPALGDIVDADQAAAKTIFKQGLNIAEQIIDSENHDNLVTAHYIVHEIAQVCDDEDEIKLPKRVRQGNFKRYSKMITKLHHEVSSLVEEFS